MSGSVVGGGLGRRLLKAFSQACSSRSAGRASALALRHLLHDEDKVAPLSKARRGDHWPAGWTDAPRKTRCGQQKGTPPSLIHRLIGLLRHLRQFARCSKSGLNHAGFRGKDGLHILGLSSAPTAATQRLLHQEGAGGLRCQLVKISREARSTLLSTPWKSRAMPVTQLKGAA